MYALYLKYKLYNFVSLKNLKNQKGICRKIWYVLLPYLLLRESQAFTFQKNCVNCFVKSPLKMIQNTFYFILKALFILKIFKFLE